MSTFDPNTFEIGLLVDSLPAPSSQVQAMLTVSGSAVSSIPSPQSDARGSVTTQVRSSTAGIVGSISAPESEFSGQTIVIRPFGKSKKVTPH